VEPKRTGHISTAEIYAEARVPFGESLRRCADALKRGLDSLAPHLEPRKCLMDGSDCGSTLCPPAEDEQEELLDEPGPQIENFFGADRYV
jgi:hypothetical protein